MRENVDNNKSGLESSNRILMKPSDMGERSSFTQTDHHHRVTLESDQFGEHFPDARPACISVWLPEKSPATTTTTATQDDEEEMWESGNSPKILKSTTGRLTHTCTGAWKRGKPDTRAPP